MEALWARAGEGLPEVGGLAGGPGLLGARGLYSAQETQGVVLGGCGHSEDSAPLYFLRRPPPHPVPHQRRSEKAPPWGPACRWGGWRRGSRPGGPPSTFCLAFFPSGVNEVDYSRYPARETQLQWLLYYLQAQKGTAVTPREVERLYVQVNKFALVSACNWEGAGEGQPPALHSEPRTSRRSESHPSGGLG